MKLLLFYVLSISLIIFYLKHSEVDTHVTKDDEKYIKSIAGQLDVNPDKRSYDDEIRLILKIQDAVIKTTPGRYGIPLNHTREPKDLYELHNGICYDKSRVMEKVLRFTKFQVRHVYVYIDSNYPYLKRTLSIFAPFISSHAVTEVKTKRGWMVIDSTRRWVSLDENKNPVPIKSFNKNIKWERQYFPEMNPIFKNKFNYIYGLYSRHGKFYPPYNSVPDVNYTEILDNFIDSSPSISS